MGVEGFALRKYAVIDPNLWRFPGSARMDRSVRPKNAGLFNPSGRVSNLIRRGSPLDVLRQTGETQW